MITNLPEEEEAKMSTQEILKYLQIPNTDTLRKTIHEYYLERKKLRRKLDSFQKEFFRIYNRKL